VVDRYAGVPQEFIGRPESRNANLRQVQKIGAEGWKRKAKYHRRSLIETAIFRLKTLFSEKLRAREDERQRTEVMARCLALNSSATDGGFGFK
jgi:hypothetical protein